VRLFRSRVEVLGMVKCSQEEGLSMVGAIIGGWGGGHEFRCSPGKCFGGWVTRWWCRLVGGVVAPRF
jgi:hypothetical protein